MPSDRLRLSARDFVPVVLNGGLHGISLLSRFLLVLVLARYSKPEVLGAYGLIGSAVAVGAFAFGLEYHYFTRRELVTAAPVRIPTIIRDQALLHCAVLVVGIPVLALALQSGRIDLFPNYVDGFFLALIASELLAQEASQTLIALGRTLEANMVMFVRTGLWTIPVMLYAFSHVGFRRVDIVLGAWCLGGVAGLGASVWFLRDLGWRQGGRAKIEWAVLGHGLRAASPFYIMTGASMGVLFFDRFVIAAYDTLESVAVYTFFASISLAMHNIVHSGVALLRMPHLIRANARGSRQDFREELHRMAVMSGGCSVALAVVLGAFVLVIVRFLDPVYARNVVVFFLILLATFLRCIADVPLYALYALGKDSALLIIQLVACGLAVGLSLLLVPHLSIFGAGLAAVISGAAIFFGALCWLSRSMRGSWEGDESDEQRSVSAFLE